MKKSKFTEAQIIGVLKELDAGTPATTVARRIGVHANTIRAWRDKYAGLETSDLVRLKQLEAENAQLRRIVARKELELDVVRDLIEKKRLGPSQRKQIVKELQSRGLSQRRACAIARVSERAMQYKSRRVEDPMLHARMKDLASERLRWGWRRLLIMIRREGFAIGERAFRRIYRSLGLHVLRTRKRHVRYVRGNAIEAATRPNERWSMDFIHARLDEGRPYRILNIVDDFTCETLCSYAAFSFGSADVIREIENIAFVRGYPTILRSDNGSEFCSRKMLRWSADTKIALHFIQPGKPTQNAKVESLNGRVRDELINPNIFRTIAEVRAAADAWRSDYNEVRPHSSLGYLTPSEFAARFEITQPSQLSAA